MPRKNLRRAASKEALKQMQLLSASAYAEEDDDHTETYEIPSDEDIVNNDMPPKKKYRLSHRKSSDGNDRDVIVLKTVQTVQTVPPEECSLKMDVWIEEISPAQLTEKQKREREWKDLQARITQMTQQCGAEITHQSDSHSIYELDSIISNFTAEKKKMSGTVKATSQNMVLQPAQATNAQNAYQLVMDPRLGFIVGTMTTTPPTNIPPPPLAKVTAPAVQTRQTRRRGRYSTYSNVSQPPPLHKPPPPPPPPQPKPSQPPTLVQLRPTESTAVGGLSTGASSSSATTPQKTSQSVAGVVDLTSDEARPAADSREISFNKLQGKTFPSLVVVARPHLAVKDISGGDRTKLDSKVKSVLMHVPTKFTEWLIQQGLIRSEQTCINHPNTKLKLGMYSDVSKFPYSGGYVWISECCPHRFVSVFSGSLFEASPHPPSVILKLIYHWACQTNIQNVVQWVKVDNLYVKGMNTWLRAICTVALHSHIVPLGGPGRRVEVGVISLGTTSQDGQQRQVKVEVLGILETNLKRIRLRAVEPLADGDRNYKKRFSKILEPLISWVHPESTIVTDLTVDKGTLHLMGFKFVQQSTSTDQTASNHTIMEYLRRIVPRMFQNTLSLLSRQIIQQFLDELVWREWFGTTAAQCFDNMLIHISEQTRADTGMALVSRLNKVASNPFKNWSIVPTSQPTTIIKNQTIGQEVTPQKRLGRPRKVMKLATPPPEPQVQRPPRTLSPDVPEQMVPLENYYYGTIEGDDTSSTTKIGWNVKCSMCKMHFSNNIKLMTHLFSHAHGMSGQTHQCRYCLSSVGSQEGLAKHIIATHPYETRYQNGFVCVICEKIFPNSFSLGKHMSKEHVPAELPYQCGTCGFRCSSHRQAIDHFYKIHDSGSTIQCPFCLKSTSVWSGGRIMPQNLNFFMQHLQKHQKKMLARKCYSCALWFIHKDTLKEHQTSMHQSQRRKAGLIPWSAPRNGLMVPKSKQDKQVWEDSERELDFNNLNINVSGKCLCKECKTPLTTPKHFQALENCSNRNCQYLTSCKSAMDAHLKICKTLNISLPLATLTKEMFCVCGYSDTDGNILAKHLATCERKSAYPSAEAARKAIKTHSMLDVLGLVRRPEEPSISQSTSAATVVEIDTDEDQEEAQPKKRRKLESTEKNIAGLKPDEEEKKEIENEEKEKEIENEKKGKDIENEEKEKEIESEEKEKEIESEEKEKEIENEEKEKEIENEEKEKEIESEEKEKEIESKEKEKEIGSEEKEKEIENEEKEEEIENEEKEEEIKNEEKEEEMENKEKEKDMENDEKEKEVENEEKDAERESEETGVEIENEENEDANKENEENGNVHKENENKNQVEDLEVKNEMEEVNMEVDIEDSSKNKTKEVCEINSIDKSDVIENNVNETVDETVTVVEKDAPGEKIVETVIESMETDETQAVAVDQ